MREMTTIGLYIISARNPQGDKNLKELGVTDSRW
jgi:hypothetical protein